MTGLDLTGRRIAVTGASAGIGEALARRAARLGAVVACIGRRAERVERLAADIGGVAVPGDISTPQGAQSAVERSIEGLGGGLDVLVNNAGLYLLGSISDADPADWRQMFDTNVLGLLYTTQAALPFLRAAGNADIVNISSVGGRRVARSTTAVYSATKFAVQAITDGLRIELQDTDIRVLTVMPGVVATELGRGTQEEDLLQRFKERQADMGLHPDVVAESIVGGLCQPREVSIHEIMILPSRQGR